MVGGVLDSSCILWEDKCGDRGSCLYYDNHQMAWYLLALCTGCKLFNVFFAVLAWWFYKGKQSQDFGLQRLEDDPLPEACDSPGATADVFNSAAPRLLKYGSSHDNGEVNIAYEDPDEGNESGSRTTEIL